MNSIWVMVGGKWFKVWTYGIHLTNSVDSIPGIKVLCGVVCPTGHEDSAYAVSFPVDQIQAYTSDRNFNSNE